MTRRLLLLALSVMLLSLASCASDSGSSLPGGPAISLTRSSPKRVVIAVPNSEADNLADFEYVINTPGISPGKAGVLPADVKHPEERLPYYAFLLSRRIEQSLGRRVPVVKESDAAGADLVFNIGPTAAGKAGVPGWNKMAPSTFSVTTDGKTNVFFAASDDTSVGFGVVDFADKVLNIRQYMAAPLGECITRTDDIKIPLRLHLANTTVVASVYLSGAKINGGQADGEFYRDTNRQMETALELNWSDSFHHNLVNIIDPLVYADKEHHPETYHPEYFPFVNGQRVLPDIADPKKQKYLGGWQPDFTNPDVFKITVAYCVRWFDEHPSATSVSIGVNDGGGWDQSDEAKRVGSKWPGLWYRNEYYDFANRVARELAKQRPGKKIGFLAYGMAQMPPPFKLEKNILVYRTHPDEPAGTGLPDWVKLGATTGVYTWLYGNNMVTPRYFPHIFARIYKRWLSEGATGFYAETYPNWIIDAPMVYAVAKIARNPDANPDTLLKQYAADMFGQAAAPSIVDFYHASEDAMARRTSQMPFHDDYTELTSFGRPIRFQFDCWRVSDIKRMDADLADAAKNIKPGGIPSIRLELLQTWWNWSREYILAYALADEVRTMHASSPKDVEAMIPTIAMVDQHVAGVAEQWDKHMGADAAAARPGGATDRSKYLIGEADVKAWQSQPGQYIDPRVWPASKIFEGLHQASDELAKSMGKDKTIAWWTKLAVDHPKQAGYFETQAELLKGNLPNLLENGSFEQTDEASLTNSKWTWPVGFVLHNSGTRVTDDIGVDDKVARTGKHSWRSGKGVGGSLSTELAVTPGSTYLVSVWVRQTTPQRPVSFLLSAFLNVDVYGSDAASRETVQNMMERGLPLDTWHKVESVVTIPPNGNKMSIQLVCKGHEEGDFTWFDDLSVVKLR